VVRALALEDLRSICPHTTIERLLLFVNPLNQTFEEFEVNTIARRAAFLAQYAWETQNFTRLVENLMYTTAEQLRAVHPHDFDKLDVDDAWGYIRQPERIANRVYAHQNGNGDEASGDGWKYRGRGLPHVTGLGNYIRMAGWLNLDLVNRPELLENEVYAARAGGAYWLHEGCNQLVDRDDFAGVTRRINGAATEGPPSHHTARVALLEKAMNALA